MYRLVSVVLGFVLLMFASSRSRDYVFQEKNLLFIFVLVLW